MGPRDWQSLGGTGGGGGELEGVEVLRDLEGVRVITESLFCSEGIRTKLSRILLVCLARTGAENCPLLCPAWIWLSLLIRLLALEKLRAAATSWQVEAFGVTELPLLEEFSLLSLLAQLFTREAKTCSVLGSSVAFPTYFSWTGEGGMEHRQVWTRWRLGLEYYSTRISVLMFALCDIMALVARSVE